MKKLSEQQKREIDIKAGVSAFKKFVIFNLRSVIRIHRYKNTLHGLQQ